MHRVELGTDLQALIATSPETSVTDAAEAMERSHARQILVGNGRTPVGMLTEEDIVAKVLALGLDPNVIRVGDIMASLLEGRDGRFQVDDDADQASPLWAAEGLNAREDEVLMSFLTGRCEECGVFSETLHDHEGLSMCDECSGFRNLLFT